MFPNDVEIHPQQKFLDNRGELALIIENIEQHEPLTLKRSSSRSKVFRGMHYQAARNNQKKIIEVIDGEVIDFLIDMRPSSVTFGKVYSYLLKPGYTVTIPGHYAHGFYCKADTIFQYLTLGKYSEKDELIIRLEPEQFLLNGIASNDVVFSSKDANGISYSAYFRVAPIIG